MAPRSPDADVALALALEQSEERYRFLTESIPVQIWTALPNGQLDYVSNQTAHSLGLTPERLLADGWQNVVHPEDLPLAVERWTHALATGAPYEVEFRLRTRGGEFAWHLARAIPQRGASGAIVRWFGTNTNIEEQRAHQAQVEGLLAEGERKTAQLRDQNQLLALEAEVGTVLTRTDSVSDALRACAEAIVRHLDAAFARIWTVDEAGTTLMLQASAGLYTHLDGAHGRVPVGQFKIGKIAAERRPHLTNQVVGDPRVGDQAWAVREGMVSFAGYPIVFGERLVGVIAAFARRPLSDASMTALSSVANALAQSLERRRAEERVRQNEAWLATTLSSIGDGVIATDPAGRITFVNPIAATLTGWTPDDAFGQLLDVVFPIVNETTRTTVESPVAKVLREGGIVALANHTTLVQRTGSEIPIEDSAAPIRDRDGRLTGVVLVFRDASEKRQAEAERIRLLAQEQRGLETMLKEQDRLLAVAEDERRKADFASRAKDEFLATASHELRTPLNAILGWARLLRGGTLDQSGFLRGLETIERNAKVQVQLIEDILDGSRIITGKLHLEIRSVDLTSVVQAAIDAVSPAASAKSIALKVAVDSSAARIKGDPDRLQQVVWNLVNNAIKFTPKGGRVDVSVARAGTHLELSVTDNGQGIGSDFLPHVFERFRQADASTTRRHGGLGLGLALVRHLVEAHGGSVRAQSEGEGRGARFSVTFPVQAVFPEVVEPARLTPTGVSARQSLPPSSLRGVTLLVLDDEADARDLVATLLRAHGAEVHVAASADAAIDLLRQHSPAVLVSDIGMPVTDGYTLIGQVRGLDAPVARISAVALTAYAREEDRRRALDAGFDAYLSKPVEPEALVRLVGDLAHASRPT